MTIAAGFRCNEGIVLCADTQETITGYIKGYEGKIVTSIFQDCIVSIAGAGTTDYIRTAKEKAIDGLGKLGFLPDIAAKIASNLLEFFDIHLGPWAKFAESERPTVDLLISVSVESGAFGLYHWNGTAFHSVSEMAIGAGILLANSLISEYGHGNHTLKQTTNLAVFILSKVKKQVDTCGGNTHVVVIRGHRDFAYLDDKHVKKLEGEAEKLESASTKKLKSKIMDRPLPDFRWLKSYTKPVVHGAKISQL
jgi:20S proteasome alpha/beta subunit